MLAVEAPRRLNAPAERAPQPAHMAEEGLVVLRQMSLEQALDKAKDDGKLVMIEFSPDDYHKLDETWRDARVRDWLRENTVAIKIDALRHEAITRKYEAQFAPTIVFLKPDGSEICRITGFRSAAEFLNEACDLIEGKKVAVRPDPKLLLAETVVYLSSMQEDSKQEFGHRGSFSKNGVLGTDYGNVPISVNGKKSEHGLGMNIPSGGGGCTVRYVLGRTAHVFKSVVAFNDFGMVTNSASVTFHVLADGKEVWKSQMVHTTHEPQECVVDISKVNELELQVRGVGHGNPSPAVWVEPRLFKDADEAQREPSILVTRTNVRIVGGKIPQSKASDVDLAIPSQDFGNAVVSVLKPRAREFPACLCWSSDGKSFYYLDGAAGKLVQVALEGLREIRRLEIGRKCTWLSTSAEGLLVTVADTQELWVIDENGLRVKDQLRVPSASRIVSAPPLSVAFSVLPANDFFGCPRLLVFDLKTGEQVDGASPTYQEIGERPKLEGARVTPDGKYLFIHGQQLLRFRIEGAS